MDAIKLENVNKRLGKRDVLKDVSFTVETGDIFGYLGPNGAGKTTTIRILLGLFQLLSGRISILGKDVKDDANRRQTGFVMEVDGLYDNLTAYANLILYSRIYTGTWSPKKIDAMLELVRLADRAKDKVGTFSKGMRQRLALARAMVHNPQVFILDEPTAGVDPTGQIEIRQVILDMVKQGKTILLSSHNLDEVQRICNRIALINRGRISLYGETAQLQRDMGKGAVTIESSAPFGDSLVNEIKNLAGINIREINNNFLQLTINGGYGVPDLVNFLVNRGVRIEQVQRHRASLEEIYTTILKEADSG